MRRAARVDANQSEIAAAFLSLGCSIQFLHAVGKGCPDLLIACRGRNLLIEIKDGAKSASRRKLTEEQKKFHDRWLGPIYVASSIQDVHSIVGAQRV